LPSASGSSGNGRFMRNRSALSDRADKVSVASIRVAPKPSRLAHRRRLATTSPASTGVLSWKRRPSRNVNVQLLASSSMLWPASICGCGR